MSYIKLGLISDILGCPYKMPKGLPETDVYVILGNLTCLGKNNEVREVVEWVRSLKSKYKVIVAGSNDTPWAENHFWFRHMFDQLTYDSDVHYLNDEECIINDFKLWGSPYTCESNSFEQGLAFKEPTSYALKENHWDKIPQGTDILITACAPQGIMDRRTFESITYHIGDEYLRYCSQEIAPMCHMFNCRSNHGQQEEGKTTYINANAIVSFTEIMYRDPIYINLHK